MSIRPNQVVPSCSSTNDLVRQFGEDGLPHGTWLSAVTQERGRGRLGREWHSQGGNLFLSLLVRPERSENWTWTPITAAVGVCEALIELFPGLPVSLKWPNDLWIDRKKLGGILCEAAGQGKDSFVVIGVGLNCASHPQGLDQPTTSLSASLGQAVGADQVRSKVIESVLKWMDMNPSRIREQFHKRTALQKGTQIQWAGGAQSGMIIGLGAFGELEVLQNGQKISLFAEDVKIRLQ